MSQTKYFAEYYRKPYPDSILKVGKLGEPMDMRRPHNVGIPRNVFWLETVNTGICELETALGAEI